MPDTNYLVPSDIGQGQYSPADLSKWANTAAGANTSGISPKAKETFAYILSLLKDGVVPIIQALKGSGAAASDADIQHNLPQVAQNVANNPALFEQIKAYVDAKAVERAANDTPKGFSIDFSSPTTWVIVVLVMFVLYVLFKGKKGIF